MAAVIDIVKSVTGDMTGKLTNVFTRNSTAISKMGDPATEIIGGRIRNEDFNEKFDEPKGTEEFERMVRIDPVVRGLLRAVMLPILSAEARIEPASDARIDKEIAAFVDANFFSNPNFTY